MTAGDKRKSSAKETAGEDQDSPFGIWLSRGLHQLFDDVANEPIPDELLRLIEEDRNK
ncbi:NepR family anti-sigma factor [Gluconobacter oxydans]|uniref:NepR family anti-sigma factor n=1 Tax=Gluconobacter oxydans TaxID=442 RepID=UPI0039E78885